MIVIRNCLLIILLIPIVVYAQEPATIDLDSELLVSVSAERPTTIQFELDEQQYISLQAESTSDEFDPVLWVVDDAQRLRAYNDDSQTSSASIDNMLLQAGDYTIYVDSFNGVSEGEVTVSLNTVSPNEITIDEQDDAIIIEGYLLADTVYRHQLAISQDTISVTVRDLSGTLDPYLVLYEDSEQVIAENDDHAIFDFTLNTFDSHLADVDVSNLETILIEVRDFLGREGQFQIIVE
ncbi:MAG: hypothetical protein AAF846_04535 [Chloroflexota bacterium]